MHEEKRITTQAQRYWDNVRLNKELPEFSNFNPHEIKDVWPFCFIVSVHKSDEKDHTGKSIPTFMYQYVGPALIDIFGKDCTGYQVLPHQPYPPAAKLIAEMEKCLQSPQPYFHESEFISNKGDLIKYRSCLLPFGHDTKTITHFLATITWKQCEK